MSIAWPVHSDRSADLSATTAADPVCSLPTTSAGQSTFCTDVRTFGMQTAVALAELSPDLAYLNRLYRQLVSARNLRTLPEIAGWLGRSVSVFLRHSDVSVFAIHCDPHIGMSNVVILKDAVFVVNQIGHQQTLLKKGPLENQSSVHAFVTGTLTFVSDSFDEDLNHRIQHKFRPVIYRPDTGASFLVGRSDLQLGPTGANRDQGWLPVSAASLVVMIPGRQKVWCRHPVSSSEPQSLPEKARHADWCRTDSRQPDQRAFAEDSSVSAEGRT